jgi:hypothetical protein
MKVNLEKSRELAQEILVRERDCFQNSLRVLEHREGAILVVGIVGDHRYKGKADEHAWLEFDGEILDPTWTTHWAETPVTEVIYQPITKMPGAEALAKYRTSMSDKMLGVANWDELISREEIDEAKKAIMSQYRKEEHPSDGAGHSHFRGA